MDAMMDQIAKKLVETREHVCMMMLLNGLTVDEGWSLGECHTNTPDGVEYRIWPVRGAEVGERPKEERPDLAEVVFMELKI